MSSAGVLAVRRAAQRRARSAQAVSLRCSRLVKPFGVLARGRWLIALVFLATAGGLGGCYRSAPLGSERALRLFEQQLAASRTSAQIPRGKGEAWQLSEAQALELALRHNPALRTLRAEAALADGELAAAHTLENPNLRLTNTKVDRLLDGEAELDLTLRVPLPHPAARGATIDRARLTALAVRAQAADARRQLQAEVRKAFALLARLAAEKKLLRQAQALYAQQSAQQAERLAAGRTTEVDSTLAALLQAEAAEELAQLEAQRAAVVQALWQLLGVPAAEGASFVLQPLDVTQAARQADLLTPELIEQALARRSDLRAAAARTEAAAADSYAARAERWPWLKFVQLGYEQRPGSGARDFTFGLALELPLLSWNSGEIAAHEAKQALRRTEEQLAVLAVAQEVTSALSRVNQARRQLAALREGLLPAAERSAAAATKAVAAGAAQALEATVAQSKQIRARRRQLAAFYELRCAWIDLEAALAGPAQPTGAATSGQPSFDH